MTSEINKFFDSLKPVLFSKAELNRLFKAKDILLIASIGSPELDDRIETVQKDIKSNPIFMAYQAGTDIDDGCGKNPLISSNPLDIQAGS